MGNKATYRTADSTHPVHKAVAVTANDSTLLETTRGLWVGTAGNVAVVMAHDGESGAAVTFTGVLGGTLLPIQVKKVMSTNTTASNILALY